MKLTKNKIQYMLKIAQLCKKSDKVRLIDICNSLGVSKASTHRMVNYLIEMGYIYKNKDYITLTQTGIDLTENLLLKYKCFNEFFCNFFCLPLQQSNEATFSLLGNLSNDSIDLIFKKINSTNN